MGKLKLGWASRDVTTLEPINIPGQFHMRISKGAEDPITLTALAVDGGEDYVIFLSADMVELYGGLLGEIRALVAKKLPSLDPMKILMNTTHTHASPSVARETESEDKTGCAVIGSGKELPDLGIKIASSDAYRAFFVEKAADAVAEAWKKRSEGSIAYGYGFAVAGHSRRTVYFDDVSKRPGAGNGGGGMVDGHGKMYGNTNDPMFSGYEAGADHFINFMYTYSPDGALTGAIINLPCPSQNSEHRYSLTSDYWADARRLLRERYGDIFILPQCAPAGDLSPRLLHYKQAQSRRFRLKYGDIPNDYAERRDIAERIAKAFGEVIDWAAKEKFSEAKVGHASEVFGLPRREITDEEYAFAKAEFARLSAVPFRTEGDEPEKLLAFNSTLLAQRGRLEGIIQRYERKETMGNYPAELHMVRIGDIAFASFPFELYMDYMHRVQARSPFAQTFAIQLAGGDAAPYLASEQGAANKGYSACLFCNQVSPAGGQEMVEETLKKLFELKES